MSNNVVTEKIGDGIELMIQGMPQSVVSPQVQAKAALAMVQHGIPLAGTLSAGVLGGIKDATLKVGRQYYELKYSIVVLRTITAAEIYTQGIQWIEFQMMYGRIDQQIGDDAISYLRNRFRREFR
jgi:hypothetical protein